MVTPHSCSGLSSGYPTAQPRGMQIAASFTTTPTPGCNSLSLLNTFGTSINIYGCSLAWPSQSHGRLASQSTKLILLELQGHVSMLNRDAQSFLCPVQTPRGKHLCSSPTTASPVPAVRVPVPTAGQVLACSCPSNHVSEHRPQPGLHFRLPGSGRGAIKNFKCLSGTLTFRNSWHSHFSFIYLFVGQSVLCAWNVCFSPFSGKRLESKLLIYY